MPYINTIECESIQTGVAPTPPTACAEFWNSLDPTKPFATQSFGINNNIGLTNQLGAQFNIGAFFGVGAQTQLGVDSCLGFRAGLGGEANAQPTYEGAAVDMSLPALTGDLGGSWTLNNVPVCASFDCSDINLKTNIKPLENCLDKVLQLRGVSFDWIEEKIPFYVKHEGIHQVGLIAQEVEQVVPELVVEGKIEENDAKSVRYGHVTALLIEAIKEQQEQINSLKQTVDELSTKLAECCS